MSSNGRRKPARPRLEMLGAPSPQDAAAIVAAVEQFLADTAPAPERAAAVNPWQRACLLEGVQAKQAVVSPWGESRGWG